MKRRTTRTAIAALLVLLAVCLAVVSCTGDQAKNATSTTSNSRAGTSSLTSLPPYADLPASLAEQLSTFRNKDPFIQQDVTSTTAGPFPSTTSQSGSTSTTRYSSTTAYHPTTLPYGTTSTTRPYGTTSTTRPPASTTTTSSSTTTTTAPHVHILEVLGVSDVGGVPTVSFKVDSTVYQDRRVGDVVSSTWGQIKVLDISTSTNVVTLLHGSETLVLSVGQTVFE